MTNLKTIPKIRFVACHRKPERSFFYKGKQFPVCSRCTGMLVGYLMLPLFLFNLINIDLWTALLANIPTFIDGYSQALGWRHSTNALRFFTGILSGIGQIALITLAGDWIAQVILKLL